MTTALVCALVEKYVTCGWLDEFDCTGCAASVIAQVLANGSVGDPDGCCPLDTTKVVLIGGAALIVLCVFIQYCCCRWRNSQAQVIMFQPQPMAYQAYAQSYALQQPTTNQAYFQQQPTANQGYVQ